MCICGMRSSSVRFSFVPSSISSRRSRTNRTFVGRNTYGRSWMLHVLVVLCSIVMLASASTTTTTTTTSASSKNNDHVSLDPHQQESLKQQKYPPPKPHHDHDHHHHRNPLESDHEPLFPWTWSDTLGFAAATVGLMVAAGGGVGGGGMLVPIYILLLEFSPHHAIPLSNITVFGGSLANTLLNAKKRHPLADRPLVDWDLILIMEPLTIAGALIGAFLNKVLPEQLLAVLLVLLLAVTAQETLSKAFKMYRKETQAFIKAAAATNQHLTKLREEQDEETEEEAKHTLMEHLELQDGESLEKLAHVPLLEQYNEYDGDNKDVAQTRESELLDILQYERTAPKKNIQLLIIMFVVVLFINIVKGGGAFHSPLGIRCGSLSFWIANAIILAWIGLISFMARSYLMRRHDLKARVGYKYVEGDVPWDARATIVYPFICCGAGFFAGMFGIGGGIVKGPLMLAMGVHPAVSSATSACMILFTSFTATTSFLVFGLVVPDYALLCLLVGFCATFVGQVGLSYLMKKSQRNSYIAFSIGGVVLLSAIMMTIQSLVSMTEAKQENTSSSSSGGGGICGTH